MLRIITLLFIVYSLAGCSIGTQIPADHFYRLPVPQLSAVDSPVMDRLVFKPVKVSGLLHDRAMLFVEQSRPLELQRHHYHFWAEAPAELIHNALFQALDKSGLAQHISRESSLQAADMTIDMQLLTMERFLTDKQDSVRLAFSVTFSATGSKPQRKRYELELAVDEPGIYASVSAFSSALQQLALALQQDLQTTP